MISLSELFCSTKVVLCVKVPLLGILEEVLLEMAFYGWDIYMCITIPNILVGRRECADGSDRIGSAVRRLFCGAREWVATLGAEERESFRCRRRRRCRLLCLGLDLGLYVYMLKTSVCQRSRRPNERR